jgi:lysophospholipase L1-like esterase
VGRFFRSRRAEVGATLVLGALCTLLPGCEEGTVPQPAPGETEDVTGAGGGAAQTPEPTVDETPALTGPTPLGKLVTADGMIRIMAIGDSITRATCWRAALWAKLSQDFSSRFDFVGTLSSDNGCTPANYDRDNQGYSSSLITEIVANDTSARMCDPNPCPALADLQSAFLMKPTDVALLHFGTNDVWNSKSPQDIVSGYTAVVAALRAANPKVVILVAQIIPMNVSEVTCGGCICAGCPSGIPALNARIASWAIEQDTPESPIRVVDQYGGYDAVADNRDGVHPNTLGSQKIADRWYDALLPLF